MLCFHNSVIRAGPFLGTGDPGGRLGRHLLGREAPNCCQNGVVTECMKKSAEGWRERAPLYVLA